MDLEIIILSEVSQKEKDKYHMISYDTTYMWNLKYGQMNLSTKQKQTHRHRDQTCGCQGGLGGGEGEGWTGNSGLVDANYYI